MAPSAGATRSFRVQPYDGIFAVLMGGDFEPSLLLLDAVWVFPTGDPLLSALLYVRRERA